MPEPEEPRDSGKQKHPRIAAKVRKLSAADRKALGLGGITRGKPRPPRDSGKQQGKQDGKD